MDRAQGSRDDEHAALLAVARQGSFVAAGRAVERHPSVVSKRIFALEERLGVRLIERTTRRVRLTEAGVLLVERLQVARGLVEDAEQEASRSARVLRGTLRVSLPATFGRLWLAPRLPTFMAQHPELRIEVDYSDSCADLLDGGHDVAIRIGRLADSRLKVRKLADQHRILAASPQYIEQHSHPADPAALVEHNCLEYPGLASFPFWTLVHGDRLERVRVSGSMRANDTVALLEAALAGVGILGAGEWLMAHHIAAGRLVRVLPNWSFDVESAIHLVRPSTRFAAARTDAFVAWAIGIFKQPLWTVREI